MTPQEALLKKIIWLYFLLLIFEGALRKWVLPGLSTPLLIVRDPVAIYALFYAYSNNIWRPNKYVSISWFIMLLSLPLTLIAGHGNLFVAIYGLRIFFIHFPLLFLIGRVLHPSDIVQFARVTLWLCIGMTVLVAVQFYSPQSAWVNVSVGGVEGSGFSGAEGFYRVPGTFSFTNGLAIFYSFSCAAVLFFWITSKYKVNKLLLIVATAAVLAAIPLSISRGLFFQVIVIIIFAVIGSSAAGSKNIIRLALALLGLGVLVLALQNFPFFNTATMAFTSRFESANEIEGGVEGVLIDRFLGGLYGAITDTDNLFLGKGMGLGTNVGSQLLGKGGQYLVAEGEWGRLIGEMGFILGFLTILIRIILGITLFKKSWIASRKGFVLPWLLTGAGILPVIQGQWAQPTPLGFAVIFGGFILAASKQQSNYSINVAPSYKS